METKAYYGVDANRTRLRVTEVGSTAETIKIAHELARDRELASKVARLVAELHDEITFTSQDFAREQYLAGVLADLLRR